MIRLRKAAQRGHSSHGWLDSYHTFSFADYHDPAENGFSVLRVINDDTVAAGAGFAPHPHHDMEIVSYVLDGGLRHRDSTGNDSVICSGEVQRLTAGSGMTHSEFNSSASEPVHFLQIWILPDKRRLAPDYEQRCFDPKLRQGKLHLIGSPDGRDDSLLIHQDIRLYATLLDQGQTVCHPLAAGRCAYVHVARGRARLNGTDLDAGDGARIIAANDVRLDGLDAGEILLFDMPAQGNGRH